MAITPPTPPTPPTVPVVPGARKAETVQQNPDSGNGTDSGREFGVHINISTPQGKQVQVHNNTDGQDAGAAPQQPATTQAADGQEQADATAQQARQAAVEKMLGLDEKPTATEEQTAQTQTAPWPLGGHDGMAMPVWPFVVVFLTAFGIFFVIQKSRQRHIGKGMLDDKQLSKGVVMPKEEVEKLFAPKTPKPVQNVGQKESVQTPSVPTKASKEEKKKGSHFEIRI